MADESADRQTLVVLAIGVEGGLILLAWLLGWYFDQPPVDQFAWTLQGVLLGLAATLPMVVFFLVLLRWPLGPLERVKQFCRDVICPIFAPCTLLDLFGISVLAGFGEEMLFRGVLQGVFTRWLDPWTALVLASVLFGLLHAVSLSYAVLATLMGAYLGGVQLGTGNLLVVVLAHALYDFLVLLWLVRGPGVGGPNGPPVQ
jgi:membrane protease YdiL (CAAX protease family)